ncbi:hypothetical protein ScPMuIL_003820 [Solemya velum]
MAVVKHHFHYPDYIVFAITLLISIGIGIFYALSGGRQRTTSEFFVGNRKMAVLPVAISLIVSFESSIMMLGVPAEIYVYGIQYIWSTVGWLIANSLAVILVVPLFHPLGITSAYEYLEIRYKSHAVRLLGTILGMLCYITYMGVVLFGPAIALEAVTGFPQWGSIIVVATGSVIYTTIGGLKAVIWTDVFQFLVMLTGMFSILIKGTMVAGGVANTWKIADRHGRLNFFVFDTDVTLRHSFWNLLIGTTIKGLGLGYNQSTVQRVSSTPTMRQAKQVILLTAPGLFFATTLAVFEGIIAFAYYTTVRCDPLESGQIDNPNQVIPYLVMDIFDGYPGMPGLFLASLFSASLSTLSSGLSSLSALLWQDIVKPHTKPMSELKATFIAKLSVVFFGIVSMGVAFGVSLVGGTLNQISASVLAAFAGPLCGLFLLGSLCPWANAKGAFLSGILGCALVFWITMGQYTSPNVKKAPWLEPAPIDHCPVGNFSSNVSSLLLPDVTTVRWDPEPTVAPKPLGGLDSMYSLSYTWFGAVGILCVMIFGSLISLMTGGNKGEKMDASLMIPIFDSICWCLPGSIRKVLRCGIDYDKSEPVRIPYNVRFSLEMASETKDFREVFNLTLVVDGSTTKLNKMERLSIEDGVNTNSINSHPGQGTLADDGVNIDSGLVPADRSIDQTDKQIRHELEQLLPKQNIP